MDLPTVARAAAAARAAIRWLGDVSEQRGGQVAIAGLGGRDLALGLGTLWALGGRKRSPRPWLIASGGADVADLVSTLRSRQGLSASAALHAWLQSELD